MFKLYYGLKYYLIIQLHVELGVYDKCLTIMYVFMFDMFEITGINN